MFQSRNSDSPIAIRNSIEWLADPGCLPEFGKATPTWRPRAFKLINRSEAKSNGLLLATFSNRFIRTPSRHFDPIGTEFVKPGRANHSLRKILRVSVAIPIVHARFATSQFRY